jgi:hypothetical protein
MRWSYLGRWVILETVHFKKSKEKPGSTENTQVHTWMIHLLYLGL